MTWQQALFRIYSRYLKDRLRVLDVGTGFSENLSILFQALTKPVIYSIDPDEDALEEAGARFRRYVDSGRLKLVKARAESLPFPQGFFDAVASAHTFHHIRDKPSALREILRVIKPGGVIVILDWTPLGGGHIHPEALLKESMEETLRLAKKLLNIVERRVERDYYFLISSAT